MEAPATSAGSPPSEVVLLGIIHEMVHAHMVAKGLPADLVPGTAPGLPDSAMLLALTAVENRVLTDFLVLDGGRRMDPKTWTKPFLAVRRSRQALMGEKAADYERRLELREAVPLFVEVELIRLVGSRRQEPPPVTPDDPSYTGFKYSLVQRVGLVLEHLTVTPVKPGQIFARDAYTGAALAFLLQREGVDWLPAAVKPTADLTEMLAKSVELTAQGQAEALDRARSSFEFQGYLDLIRESQAKAPSK